MKKVKKIEIDQKLYNQLVKFSKDSEYRKLVKRNRKDLLSFSNNQPDAKFMSSCKREIKMFLMNKSLPTAWIQPIYNMIVGKYEFDFPMDNSISLYVGNQEITRATEAVLVIKNTKTGELVGDNPTVSIVLTSKVSVDHIIKFIKDNKKEIEHWQEVFELPDFKDPSWKNTAIAVDILRMKDEDGMTFSQIADFFSENTSPDNEDYNLVSDENNIKSIYYRYKNYLK